MNRTATIAFAAITTLVGCAEETGTGARPTVGFAGIERSSAMGETRISTRWTGPEQTEDGGPVPADIAPGAYWVEVEEVYDIEGDADMKVGQTVITTIGDKGGIPLLQGMAPIWEDGERVFVDQVETSTVAPEDGDCTATTMLAADGEYGEDGGFTMRVVYEDRVEGDDCEKLGYGREKVESVSFRGAFRPMESRVDEQDVETAPAG